MNRSILTYALTLTLATCQSAMAEKSILQPLRGAPASKEEAFFPVVKGEAEIAGDVIKLIVVKPEHLTASYKNDSANDVFPKYTVSIYNAYGYLLGSAEVGRNMFGGSPRLEPGDVGGEKVHLKLIDIKRVFKHTQLDLPDDFVTAAWLSLSASNTKLAKQDGDVQSATDPEPKP